MLAPLKLKHHLVSVSIWYFENSGNYILLRQAFVGKPNLLTYNDAYANTAPDAPGNRWFTFFAAAVYSSF